MSSQRQQETGTAQVHGRLGAELLQLLSPVHTVYLAGWLLPCCAEVTGISEGQPLPPLFGIAVPQAGDRCGNDAAAGSQSLHGGREWECSLVAAGGTPGSLP
jgi:hypothetical protein